MNILKNLALTSALFLGANISIAQTGNCADMEPICTDAGLSFTATTGTTSEPGNDYGCLSTTPNPSWYYLEIATDGDIDMSLVAPSDIDFIIWGPFTDLATAISYCGSMGVDPAAPEVDCSYSGTASETPSIPGAITGEVYVMLITNYAAVVQDVTLTQTGGTGSTNCDIIVPDPCISFPGTYTVSKNGSLTTAGSVYLCDGDSFTLSSNDDYTLPNDTIPAPIGDGIYSAQLMWLVYDAPPASADPSADPGFTGLIIPGEDIMDINDGASPVLAAGGGCGTYWFVPVAGDDGVGGNGGVADGVTDNGGLDWDKNGNGCYELGTPIEVTYACAITATITQNCSPPAVVNGVDFALTGGSGAYTVVNLGAGNLAATAVPNGGTALVTDLNNGNNYSIQVTDAEGCVHVFSGVFSGPVINSVVITPATTCPAGAPGDVDVTVIGGAGFPYNITMNGSLTAGATATYSDLAGTAVTIIASDGDGCIADSVVTITSAGHFIDVDITAQSNVSCFGVNDGTATITAEPVDASGAPDGSVTGISWDPPIGAPISGPGLIYSMTDMMAGTWLVTITDDTGCEVTIPVEITEPNELDIYVSSANEPVCYGYNDGSITVAAEGGAGGYVFTWDPTNPVPGNTFNTIPSGDYWAYVTDANGCRDSVFHMLDQPDSLWAEFTLKDINCFGDFTGSIVADTVYNGVGVVSYFWNLGGLVPNPPSNVNVASGLPAGTYVLTIQDEYCDNEYTFVLDQNPPLEFVEFGADPAYCRQFGFQRGNGVIWASAGGGEPDYSYLWTHLETGDTETSTTWGGLNPGSYQMTVIDDFGCVLQQTIEVDSVNPIAAFSVVSDELDQFLEGTAVVCAQYVNESEYFANPNNPNADTTFFWTLGYGESPYISHDYNEVIDTCYYNENVYEVCLVAINKNGCTDTTCKEITVFDVPVLVAPNVFTPDGDGINDVFTFDNLQIAIVEFECTIYDRWGLEIAALSDITQSWDGTTEGGKKCADGVYFYRYTATSSNSTEFEGQGSVTLLGEK